MKNVSFKIRFILDKRRRDELDRCHIYVRLYMGKVKSEASLYESILPGNFDEHRGRVKVRTKEDTRINHKIIETERKINDIRFRLELNGENLPPRKILQLLKTDGIQSGPTLLQFFDDHIKQLRIKKEEYTEPVIRHYLQTRSRLELYLKTVNKEHILLKDFARPDIIGFEDYLLTTVVKELGRPVNRNTCNRYLKKLKAVIRKALVLDLISKYPFMDVKIREVPSNRTYLTEPELKKIMEHSLGNNASLGRVRDIFLFSCHTGLRFSDAMSLTDKQVYVDKNKQYWIARDQDKTNDPIHIPLLKEAKRIYDKHSSTREKSGYVLPRLVNQKVNSGLKVIGELTGITKTLTHHVARHTCACLLLNNGIELAAVSKFLGHQSVKTTQIYAKITKKSMDNIADVMDKLE
ncbi:MAG: tyrosine-type recombinase/integrase [Bacteroidia bacterium]